MAAYMLREEMDVATETYVIGVTVKQSVCFMHYACVCLHVYMYIFLASSLESLCGPRHICDLPGNE